MLSFARAELRQTGRKMEYNEFLEAPLSPNNQACRIKDGGCPLVDDNAALCLKMYSMY